MMKGKGKRGEVPVEDELPFNPVRRTEARTVGGVGGVQGNEDGQTTRQIKKKKEKDIKFLNQCFIICSYMYDSIIFVNNI